MRTCECGTVQSLMDPAQQAADEARAERERIAREAE